MKELFKKYIDNLCSPEEVKLLLKEFDAGNNEEFLKSLILRQLEFDLETTPVKEEVHNMILSDTYNKIKKEIRNGNKFQKSSSSLLIKQPWFRIMAAAVLILLAAGTYLLFNKSDSEHQDTINIQQSTTDIAPGGNKALLTLADGSAIVLDSAADGMISQQGNIKVLKLDNGLLAYSMNGKRITENDEAFFNTISTPRGGQYQVTLSDGTKVWLNAASSIRFPVVFTGTERKVQITGEVYFEVAKNAAMPFKVKAALSEVEVLGTHFNVNAYDDEATINTTLLEGSVKVTGLTTHDSRLITPGQQAGITKDGKINVIANADTEEAVAWINGRFQYKSADIQTILRQISRWYDVDVVYRGNVNIHFTGQLPRNQNVSGIFEKLELTGEVKFKIDGKKIIVSAN